MRLRIAVCLTKEAQSESLALGWTLACDAWQGERGQTSEKEGKG